MITETNKHLEKILQLHKYFNKNNIKVSYSCMPNLASIASHNRKILNTQHSTQMKECNCKGGATTCPLDGKCLTDSLVYKEVSSLVTRNQNTLDWCQQRSKPDTTT